MNFNNVEFLISAAAPKDFPRTRLPEIAFAGKSNVGKSSLLNKIFSRKRTILHRGKELDEESARALSDEIQQSILGFYMDESRKDAGNGT